MELLLILVCAGFIIALHRRVTTLEQKIAAREQESAPPTVTVPTAIVSAVAAPTDVEAPPPPQGYKSQPQEVAQSVPAEAGFDEVSGGRWLGRVGIAAIFIGVAFFLKYAFDTNLITIAGRIVLGVLTGSIFIASGQYLRRKYETYAYLLVGGGVALLYLSCYFAYSFYQLISQQTAFLLMMFVTALTIALSVLDDSEPLAVLAILGGFATPYLASSGQNDPFTVLTYVVILNIVAVVLAARKRWVTLTYISFVGTGLQYFTWYGLHYSVDQLSVAMTYLTIFFAIYLGVPIFRTFAGMQSTEDEWGLVTVNAFGYFSTAYYLLNSTQHDSLWLLALLLSGIYFVLAYVTHARTPADTWLPRYYAGLATIFVTIAIPLKLDHSWITLAWLSEAALLYAIAFWNKYPSLKLFAAGAYVLSVGKLFFDYVLTHGVTHTPFFNEYVALFVVAIAVAYFVAYLYSRFDEGDRDYASIASIFFVVANILTIYILTSEVSAVYDIQAQQTSGTYGYQGGGNTDLFNQRNTVISILWSVYSVLLISIGFGAKLRIARVLGLVFSFLTAVMIFMEVWSFGDVYRIIASIVFGAVALLGSFLYVKYSQRIKAILYT